MAGNEGQVRYGLESSEGVPWHDYTYARFASETFTPDLAYEPDPNIDPSGNAPIGDNLQATGSGKLTAGGNSEAPLPIRAHMHGYYEIGTPAVGVRDWTFRDFDETADTPIAHYLGSMHLGFWRAERTDPSEYRVNGAQASVYRLSVDAFKHVIEETDFLYLRDSYSRVVEQAVNAAWLGDSFVRGFPVDTTDYYKMKVVDPGAVGVATVVWGFGAAAYGTTEYPTSALMDIMNPDDTIAGTREEPYQLQLVAVGVLTANDEFRIYPTTPKPVAVFTERPTLNATKLELEILAGGVTINRTITQFSISQNTPKEGIPGLGSKYFGRIDIPAQGQRWWEVQLNADYEDRKLAIALRNGAVCSAYAKFYGNKIGATALDDFTEFTIPNMKLTAAGTGGVTTAGRLPENPVLRSFPVVGTPICTEVRRNAVTSIAPTA